MHCIDVATWQRIKLKKISKIKIRTYECKKINFIIILSTSSNYFLKNFIFSINTFSCSLLKLESTISG